MSDVAMIYLVNNTSGGLELNLTFNVNCYFPSERYSAKEKLGKALILWNPTRSESPEATIAQTRFLRQADHDQWSQGAEEP